MENTLEITNQNDVVIENYINNLQLDLTKKNMVVQFVGKIVGAELMVVH